MNTQLIHANVGNHIHIYLFFVPKVLTKVVTLSHSWV